MWALITHSVVKTSVVEAEETSFVCTSQVTTDSTQTNMLVHTETAGRNAADSAICVAMENGTKICLPAVWMRCGQV